MPTRLPAKNHDVRGPIPVTGVVAIVTGFGLLLALQKFVRQGYIVNLMGQILFIGIAVFLALWGLRQLHHSLWPPSKYRFHQLNRHRFNIPREGLGYLGITIVMFIASFTGRSNPLLLVFALMVGPWILNGWIAFTMCQRTIVNRRTRNRAMAGEIFVVDIEFENRKLLFSSWMMTVIDRIRGDRSSLDANVMFFRIPPRSSRSISYQVRLAERGKYTFGPIEVMTRFPLGLVQRGLIVDVTDEIVIHPRVGRLRPVWQRNLLDGVDPAERSAMRRGVFDDEFSHLREYRQGDNTSAIHWRTSARYNELMVCEYRQDREHSLAALLDLWLPDRPTADERERVELAISLAATLGVEHLQRSRESNLYVAASGSDYGRWENDQVDHSMADSLLDMLALVQAGPSQGLETMLHESQHDMPSGVRVLLITTRRSTDASYAELESVVTAIDSFHDENRIQIVHADRQSLQGFFTLV